jgi:hypothetical protein
MEQMNLVCLKHIDYHLWWKQTAKAKKTLCFQIIRMDERFREHGDRSCIHHCKVLSCGVKVLCTIRSDLYPDIEFSKNYFGKPDIGVCKLSVYLRGVNTFIDENIVEVDNAYQTWFGESEFPVEHTIHVALKCWDDNWQGWNKQEDKIDKQMSLPVEPIGDSSFPQKTEGSCHLRYKLWNVENVVLFKIFEQNEFPLFEFRSKNGSSVYPYNSATFHWSYGASRCLIGLPSKTGIRDETLVCHRMNSTKEAELAIEKAQEALREWSDSLGNGFVVAELV